MSFWHRVEPTTIDTDVEEGIEARVADPLWMMARQWQLGEFKGEDAATPIHARTTVQSNAIDTFRNDADPERPVETLGPQHPLEARVEAEAVLDGPAAVLLAAEAGAQFLRRLELAGLGTIRRDTPWRDTFGFDFAAEGLDTSVLPAPTRRRLDLLERRGLDGRALFHAGTGGWGAVLSAGDRAAAEPVYSAWRQEYEGRFREPGDAGDCWVDERLEYRFSIGAATDGGEVVLAADEYHGGHLDWYAFRVDPKKTHGLEKRDPQEQELQLLPTPATFRGQGAARWWEFEDRSVYFGNLSAGPADVARMVVAEFATVFGDDWFVIPVRVDVGTLNRVTGIRVFDVFGEWTDIQSTALQDHKDLGGKRPFRFFELEGDESVAQDRNPWLLVPPALADSQDAPTVERVTLVRDENANLAWAIEDQVELPTGRSMRRRQQWERPDANGGAAYERSEGAWGYKVQTPVPPWWIPLVPERTGPDGQMRLRRARMQTWEELDPRLVGAQGQVMGPRRPLRIFEEEVPHGGVQVTRGWQRTRGADGSVHVWMARRKRPGRSDRASGLEFDTIDVPAQGGSGTAD